MKQLLLRMFGWHSLSHMQRDIIRFRVTAFFAGIVGLLPFPLARVLMRHRSDKHRPGGHLYGHAYGRVLGHLKYQPIKLLEIGIGGYGETIGGRSLLAWLEYFPFGSVVACDIEDKSFLQARRLTVYRCDQSSTTDLAWIKREQAPFDVIIDDGSHLNRHQIFTFYELFDSLKNGGIYIIEDVQTSFWPTVVSGMKWDGAHPGSPEFHRTCVGHFMDITKCLNHSEFISDDGLPKELLLKGRQIRSITFEHNLIIIYKEANETPSNLLQPAVTAAK